MIKLYDEDAYAVEFEAKVVSCELISEDIKEKGQDKEDLAKGNIVQESVYALVLDQTLFFPEEGGQSPDKGTINGIEVMDVQIQNDIVTHFITKPMKIGETVQGIIDWNHRFSNMQQHSGEHIFSGIVNREYGFNNVGFHLSDNGVTMDFDGVLTDEQIARVEWKVNEAIVKNIPIEVSFPSKEVLETLEYRSKIEIDGAVRIVTIPGYDVCACCAPHVKRTGEIGMLKVMNVQNYKGGVRVNMLCGFRALIAYREKIEVVSGLTGMLSTSQDTILKRVEQLKENVYTLKQQMGGLKQDIMFSHIAKITEDEKDIILFEEDLDTPIMRNVVNALMEDREGICAVFVGNDASGYRFILGSSVQDCSAVAVSLREAFGAKCGGSKSMIQGSVMAEMNKIDAFFEPHEE